MTNYERHDRLMDAEVQIFRDHPQLYKLLTEDLERKKLRVRLRCPRGHLIETLVLDADHNWHLSIHSLVAYKNLDPHDGDQLTENVAAATTWRSEDSASAERVKLTCPRSRCSYAGTKTRLELLGIFIDARLVRDTLDALLTD